MHVVTIQTADPVEEKRAAAHALCGSEEVDRGCSVGLARGLDVDYFLARGGWGRWRGGETGYVEVFFFGVV